MYRQWMRRENPSASDEEIEARASAAMIKECDFNRGQRRSEDLAAIIGQAQK